MIYLKDPLTNKIVKGASFGNFFDTWKIATKEEIADFDLNEAKTLKIAVCQEYLKLTDWQVIRLVDATSVKPVREGVADKRVLARSLQVQIAACTTLEELNAININFE